MPDARPGNPSASPTDQSLYRPLPNRHRLPDCIKSAPFLACTLIHKRRPSSDFSEEHNMNRAYRLIFNRILNDWVAVAEIAKSCSKGGRGKAVRIGAQTRPDVSFCK